MPHHHDLQRPWRARARLAAPLLAAGLLAVGLLVLTAGPASAHAVIVSSQPEAGSDLAAAPGVVTLRFSEPLIEDLSSAKVIDPAGRTFQSGPTGEREITVDLGSTAQGTYRVEWKTVSPIDGHTRQGRFEFGVGADVGAHTAASGAPTPADLAIAIPRAVEYAGLLGALGLLTLAALAAGAGLRWAPRGLHRWMALAGAGGAATVAGELLLAAGGLGIPALRAFLLAPAGIPRGARLILEVVAVWVTWRSARRAGDGRVPHRSARVAAALLSLTSLALLAVAGHAAAAGQWGILADIGHLWAAGAWAGSLLVLATQRPPGGWRSDIGRRLIDEFAPIALATFAATVLLGSVRGVQELAAVSDLWSDPYGQVLGAKIAVVAAMLPLSWRAWRRRGPRARTEGWLALGAVLAAAVLAAFPVPPGRAGDEPAAQPEQATQGLPEPGDLTLARAAGDTVAGLSVRPGEPGSNDLYVHLVPPEGSDAAGPIEVSLTVDDADPTTMRRCGAACRAATTTLDGGETLTVELSDDSDGATATFRLPDLPAPDGSALVQAMTDRMSQLGSYRYEEVFGPVDPPILSTWSIDAPDRLHGVTRQGRDEYSEIIRIDTRRWTRNSPDGSWEVETGDAPVQANRFIWDYDGKTAVRIIGRETLDDIEARVVSFYVDAYDTAIWYRLWVDDDHLVRKAEMRAQGHFMDRRYDDLDAPVNIRPPT